MCLYWVGVGMIVVKIMVGFFIDYCVMFGVKMCFKDFFCVGICNCEYGVKDYLKFVFKYCVNGFEIKQVFY